ncbi:DUF1254 domain-containing protein [Labilibacter sediminis]|nr:DUF1254 domain-containing protein [Labilibacter sediminis]
MKRIVIAISLVSAVCLYSCLQAPASETKNKDPRKVQTRIGELEFSHAFEHGFPTEETVQKLYDEMDFQRACQAYLWGLPFVSLAEWQKEHEEVFGANDGDFVIYTSYKDKLGILTANATTPYVFSFVNLANTGPMVLELQPGLNASGISNLWQRNISDVGAFGPDQCKGGKYLILPPGSQMPDVEGYFMVRPPSLNIGLGFRALMPEKEKGIAWIKSLQLYPYDQKDNKSESRFIEAEGRDWSHAQPRGMAYWERLADIINNEIVQEHDRVMMAMLKPLGIEKGKPFNPDERQIRLLTEAAQVGEAMAKATTFEKRFEDVYYNENTHWKYPMVWHWTHETEFYHQLDEMASYTYEAIGTNEAMSTQIPGIGQAYLGAYKDSEGRWLDGSNSYKLHIPPNPPAKQFWSLTLYDVDTRCLIKNEQQIADKSSRMDLITNDDGSVDLYFGPEAQEGMEKNWIPTTPNQGFFAYLRLYAPLEPYFERTWALPDIEKIN